MNKHYFSVDDVIFEKDCNLKKIGKLHFHKPTKETKTHAESLNVPKGEFARLTGTIFVFNSPNSELMYYEVR